LDSCSYKLEKSGNSTMKFEIYKQLITLFLLRSLPRVVKGAKDISTLEDNVEDLIQAVHDLKKIEDGTERSEQNGSGRLGESCFRNRYCDSGICSGTITGICAECDGDDDCGAPHLPGTMTKAFCYKGGDYPVCSEFKRGEPIPPGDGYPIFLGTDNDPPVWIPRHIIQGPAMTLVWHFDLNNQPEGFEQLSVSSTHIKIPFSQPMLAGYSMDLPMFDEQETGILSTQFTRNPTSIVTPFASAGAQEKYHTLTTNKNLPTNRAKRIREEVAGRNRITKRAAKTQATFRAGLTMGHIGANLAIPVIESNQDVRQMIDVREYIDRVHRGELSVDELDIQDLDERSAEAIEALTAAKTLSSIKSENHCSHFETHESLIVGKKYMEFPLNKPIHMLKGITQFFPSYFFAVNSGAVVVKYDANSNSLEFRFQAFQQSRMNGDTLDTSVKSGLWVAPIFDHYPVHPEDGRTDEGYDPELDRWEFKDNFAQYNAIPVDYSYFDRKPTCSAKTADSIEWTKGESELDPNANIFQEGFNNAVLAKLTVDISLCTSMYMKADNNPGVVGLGMIELIVILHIITEIYPEDRRPMLTTTSWDDYVQFYRDNEGVGEKEEDAIVDEIKNLEKEIEEVVEDLTSQSFQMESNEKSNNNS